ncbi:DUF5819 family protein [Brevibacterium sp. 239c]|uniref:DUF5819 family protein n=1 Tax=Brevibacterium sp. 239c TaxID=1965356 RepID=UPI0035B502EE
MRPYVGGWTVPGWRFFAPNPGNQNVHVLVRTRDAEGTQVSDWKDLTLIGPLLAVQRLCDS